MSKLRRRLLFGFLAVWIVFVAVSGAVVHGAHEMTDTAPEIVLPADFHAVRNLAETGDLLVFGRLHLPEDDWEHWTVTGVMARLIFDQPGSGTLQERVPASLGWGLLAFYLPAGHPAPWGSSIAWVAAQGNPSFFIDVNEQNRLLTYNSPGADGGTLVVQSEQRRAALCGVFKSELQAIEQVDSEVGAGDLVSGSEITAAGTQMVALAFSGAVSLLPECFVVGAQSTGQEHDPTDAAFRDDLIGEVESSAMWGRWEAALDEYGADPVLWASLIALAFSGLAFLLGTMFSGPSLTFGIFSGLLTLFAGSLWVPHVLLQIVFVILAVLGMLGLSFFAARLPR